MDYEIVYSPIALADFDIADKYIADLRKKLKNVSKRPKTGERLYYDDIFTGMYYVTHKKYSAFYRIRAGRIEVGRVLYNRSAYISLVIKSMNEE